MANWAYGGKIGMSSLINFVTKVCDIYMKFNTPLIAYIEGSGLDPDQITTLVTWLNQATLACSILNSLKRSYESI